MIVAVTSQNRRTITDHAGKCRKFWLYEVQQGQVKGRSLLELPIEQAFHGSSAQQPHPLDGINVLITGGMGPGLRQRLLQKGIQGVVTLESDPDEAVQALLAGSLENVPARPCSDHAH